MKGPDGEKLDPKRKDTDPIEVAASYDKPW